MRSAITQNYNSSLCRKRLIGVGGLDACLQLHDSIRLSLSTRFYTRWWKNIIWLFPIFEMLKIELLCFHIGDLDQVIIITRLFCRKKSNKQLQL